MVTKKSKTVLKEVQDFRDCVKRVVAMLSGKDIPVAECGDQAFVRYNKRGEPVLVNIPSIPDDATPTLMNAVRGFLDHEVAHILFTDATVAKKMRDKKKAPSTGLWNALEDVFIERKMGQVFNGTRRNLLATQKLIIDKYFKTKVADAISACRGDQRELFLKFFLCPVVRAWDGQNPFLEFMEENWHHIDKPIALLKEHGIDKAVRNMSSTEDCVKVAAAIAQIMKDMMEKPEGKLPEMKPSPKKRSKKEKDDDRERTSIEDKPDAFDSPDLIDKHIPTKSKAVSEADKKPTDDGGDSSGEMPDPATEEDGMSASVESIEDDADMSDGYGKGGGDSTAESDEKSDEDSSLSSGSDDKASDEGTEAKDEAETDDDSDSGLVAVPDAMTLDDALKVLAETEDEIGEVTEDALAATITKELSDSTLSGYRPYDRSYDFLGMIDDAEDHIRRTTKVFGSIPMYSPVDRYRMVPEGRKLFEMRIEKHLSEGASSTLAKDLERAIASRNRIQFIPGQRSGRIHGASLYRLAMNDDRVFRKKEDHRAVNACVQQVIDLSGSMGGRKIFLALASAYTIADALDRINVPNIITGFTTFGNPDHEITSKAGFSRFEALMLPIIKNWNEKANSLEIRTRMGCVGETFPLLNNVDGESIAQLASLFSGRTEDKKIMLVMSDGAPCAAGGGFSGHLRSVAREIEQLSDIDLMAIGILTNAPQRYYKNYALVNSVEEIGPSVVTELSRIILG